MIFEIITIAILILILTVSCLPLVCGFCKEAKDKRKENRLTPDFWERFYYDDYWKECKGYVSFDSDTTALEENKEIEVNISLYNDKTTALDQRLCLTYDLNKTRRRQTKNDVKFFAYEFTGYVTCNLLSKLTKGKVGFYELEIVRTNSGNDKNQEEYINGHIVQSASPVNIFSAYIKIIAPTECKDARSELINRLKEHITSHKEPHKINIGKEAKKALIFNIGQANCGLVKFGNKSAFIDIGFPAEATNPQKQTAQFVFEKIISRNYPDYVFLTHWDLDHCLGVCEYSTHSMKDLFTRSWVAPNPLDIADEISTTALRLCVHLIINNSIQFISILEGPKACAIVRQGITVYTGECKRTKLTRQNNSGLIYLIKGANKNFLFPGDADYLVFADNLNNEKYDFIVAPHHCSEMSSVTIRGNKKAVAYLTTRKGGKNKPFLQHETDLEDKGFNTIPLHEQNEFQFIEDL